MPKPQGSHQERILLLRLSALGDVVMLLPVLRAMEAQYPGVEIVLVSQPFAAGLVSQFPNVRLLPARIRAEHKGLRGLWRLAGEIQALGPYRGIADTHSVLRVWILLLFLRIRLLWRFPRLGAIDKGRREKALLTKRHGKKLQQLKHSVQRYAEVLRQIGYLVEVPQTLGGFAGGAIPDKLDALLSGSSPVVGFAPFAKHRGKIYPLENAKALVEELVDKRCTVILFGGGERELAVFAQWRAISPKQIVVLPDWDLRFAGELEVMSRLGAMVSMDSANMHLASWAGTEVLSIWGATHPFAGFLGWGQSSAHAISREDLACRPCSIYGNRPCLRADYACMDIPPQRIAQQVLQLCSSST